KLCRHALWLNHGQVMQQGDVFDVTQAYLAWHERKQARMAEKPTTPSGMEFEVAEMHINGNAGNQAVVVGFGEPLQLRAVLDSRDGRTPVVMFGIVRADGTPVYGVSSEMDGVELLGDAQGRFVIDIEFDALNLLPGSYNVRAHAMDSEGVRLFDTFERGLTVRGTSREFGLVRLSHRWHDASGHAND